MKLCLYFAIGIFSIHTLTASLVVHFDENQIKGSILFTDDGNGNTNVSYQFNNTFRNVQNITKIKIYKALPKPYKQCYKSQKGSLVNELKFNVTSSSNDVINGVTINGNTSIIAHTVILYDEMNKTLTCSVILPSGQTHYFQTMVIGRRVSGELEFLQNGNGVTAVFGKFILSDGSMNMSYPLKWRISSTGTTDGMKCDDAGLNNVFNPNDKDSTQCSAENMNECPMGDLSSKHGDIMVGGMEYGNVFVVDTNLDVPDIKGKALVLMKDNEIKACGNIRQAGPWTYYAAFDDHVTGNITFTQESPYHLTTMAIGLDGLNNEVKSYHVHNYPIEKHQNKCSPKSVGGHLNPYGVNIKKSPLPGEGTMDEYEIGDLSGKFGFLSGKTKYQTVVKDSNLPLYTSKTILGRSVVLHADNPSGTRMTCADIVPKHSNELGVMTNFTKLNISGVEGFVIAKQWKSKDGMYTPTVMIVKLWRKNGRKTRRHNWHVHSKDYNQAEETGTCMSVGGHYNPSQVSVSKEAYKKQCSAETYYRCELGDTSAKCGTCDIDGNKRYFVDPLTPIFGEYTISGRSFTFHGEDEAAARLACADIMPMENNMVKKLDGYVDGTNMKNKLEVKDRISSYLNLEASLRWKINSIELRDANNGINGCKYLSFYILGESQTEVDEHVNLWNSIIKSDNGPERCASSMTIPSVLLIFAVLSVTKFFIQ